jgi:Flp pilus assembly protein CpaB
MSKMRIVMFVLAAVAALAAGLMARGLVGSAPTEQQVVEAPKLKTVDVIVAAKDIKQGEKL